jgi:carbon storage regulator
MLVITRRIGEEVVIADDIHVTVLSVKGKQVRLGIMAPSSVLVRRLELLSELPPARLDETPGRTGRIDGQDEQC